MTTIQYLRQRSESGDSLVQHLWSKCKYETKLAWVTAELHCISLNKSERQQRMLEKKGPKRNVHAAGDHDVSLCTQKQP